MENGIKKKPVMKNGSPGNLSIGQGISRFLFAASCGGRTTPGFPGQISGREGWRRWGGGLQVHCQCHDRQRYGMLGEISGRALVWLKANGLIRWRVLPFSVELRYFCTSTAQPNRTIYYMQCTGRKWDAFSAAWPTGNWEGRVGWDR